MSDYTFVSIDGKDLSDAALKVLRAALKQHGVFLYDDPRCEGTDTVGLIVTKFELRQAQLRALVA